MTIQNRNIEYCKTMSFMIRIMNIVEYFVTDIVTDIITNILHVRDTIYGV
jgi:hypothetical protein